MMSRAGSVARVAMRTAPRRAMSTHKPLTPATGAPKTADPLLAADSFVVKFEQKALQIPVSHAVWDPTSKSNAWVYVIGGAIAVGTILPVVAWEVQGYKWRKAQGL